MAETKPIRTGEMSRAVIKDVESLSSFFGWYGCFCGVLGSLAGAFTGPTLLIAGVTHLILGVAFFFVRFREKTLWVAVC